MKALHKALAAVFPVGRYGWKPGGIRACRSAGNPSVKVGFDAAAEKTVPAVRFFEKPGGQS